MSQKMMLKPTIQQSSLLSLNIRNVDELFPGFKPGDFAVIYGSSSIDYLTSLVCIRAQLPTNIGGLNANALLIDNGNNSNQYQLTRLLQRYHLDLKQALNRIHNTQSFTAYQLTSIITEHLRNIINEFNAKVVIISDISNLFLTDNISDEEAFRVFNQIMLCLKKIAIENQIIMITTFKRHTNNSRNAKLLTITKINSDVIIALNQTLYDSEFELEKHPYLLLGSAEFPSSTPTLMDFT